MRCLSSQKIALAYEHIRILDRRLGKFKAADIETREEIIEDAADRIKSTWTYGAEFNRDAVISVRELPSTGTLDHSQIFLAYSPTLAQQG